MTKILLIEDNPDIRENTAEILELANYLVFTAGEGKEGVETAIKEKPDLIICDIMMPVLDGYGVLHLLNKNPDTQNIPFIFLSAKTEKSDIRKGMSLGADDYITKPFDGTELLEAVEGRLRKAGMIKEKIAEGIEGFNRLLNATERKDAMQSLREGRTLNKYKKKQIIFSEGNRPSGLYYIKKGKVRTFKSNENTKELVMDLYNEGDFLGYTALLEESNYKDTAEAMEECELAIIPKEEFQSLLNNNREIANQFIKLLAKNISEKKEQLLGLAYNSLRKKVADAIIKLNEKYNPGLEPGFSIHISRENLATIAGTATESLIRTLSDFKNEQLIDIKNGCITIQNEKKLANMIN